MTYNVFSGTLNPTHFTSLHCLHLKLLRDFQCFKHADGKKDVAVRDQFVFVNSCIIFCLLHLVSTLRTQTNTLSSCISCQCCFAGFIFHAIEDVKIKRE